MKIYRASYIDCHSEHQGYEYFSNKSEAIKSQNKNNREAGNIDEILEINFHLTKNDVLALLNAYASHPDNG